jgi:hypothetical protein
VRKLRNSTGRACHGGADTPEGVDRMLRRGYCRKKTFSLASMPIVNLYMREATVTYTSATISFSALRHAPLAADAAHTKRCGACGSARYWPASKKASPFVPSAVHASLSSCCNAGTYEFYLQAITQQLPRARRHTSIDEVMQRREVAWLGDRGQWALAQCHQTHAGHN